MSLSYSLPCPVQKRGKAPLPGLSSPLSRTGGWGGVGVWNEGKSHLHLSLLPANFWNIEAFTHMCCQKGSEGFRNSSTSSYQSPRKIRSAPCSCAPTCTLLIFQSFLSIAVNGVVPPGCKLVHSGIVIMKDLDSITHYADFLHGCTHHETSKQVLQQQDLEVCVRWLGHRVT